jgi:hypothetical protein
MIHRKVMNVLHIHLRASNLLRRDEILWEDSRWLKCGANLAESVAGKIEATSLFVYLFEIHRFEQLVRRLTNRWHTCTDVIQVLVFVLFHIGWESGLHRSLPIEYLHGLVIISEGRIISLGDVGWGYLCEILYFKFLLLVLRHLLDTTDARTQLPLGAPHLARYYLLSWVVHHCRRFVINYTTDHLSKIRILLWYLYNTILRWTHICSHFLKAIILLLLKTTTTSDLKLFHFIINFELFRG